MRCKVTEEAAQCQTPTAAHIRTRVHTHLHTFIYLLVWGHGVHVATRGQLVAVCSPTTCVAGIELRWAGLVAGAFAHGAISRP